VKYSEGNQIKMKGSKRLLDLGATRDSNGRWYFIIEWVKVMTSPHVRGPVVTLHLPLLAAAPENIALNDLGNSEDANYLRRELEQGLFSNVWMVMWSTWDLSNVSHLVMG
jgi:hypothetical protein